MTKADLAALARVALASGTVTVTRVETGAKALDFTARDWAAAVRSPVRVGAADAERLADRRREVAHDAILTGDREFAGEVSRGLHDRALMG